MTDVNPLPAALEAIEDIELEFDVAPAPAKKSRRAPAKGRDTEAGASAPAMPFPPSAAPDKATAEEPADPPAPVPQPGDASAGSAIDAFRSRRRIILPALVGCSMVTSLMSLGGLIAVSRNLAALHGERDQVEQERAALAHVPELVAAIRRAGERVAVETPAAPPTLPPPGGALTRDDLRRGLDELRLALDKRQPEGLGAISGTMQAGFGEIDTRLDRIETAIQPRTAHPAPAPRRN